MARPPSFLPPHKVVADVFAEQEVDALLGHALRQEAAFEPTSVRNKGGDIRVDAEVRRSMAARNLGPFEPLFAQAVMDRAPALMAELGVSPATLTRLELELVAHGDGAFFSRHIDTRTGAEPRHVRVLSSVYYFHRRLKAFDGGELRLFAIGDDSRFVDIEPVHNTLVVFPSWAPHEVRPVRCPSGRFEDSRFAVNAWVYGEAGAALAS